MTVNQVARVALIMLGLISSLGSAAAQTRSTRDTTTAYGSRMTANNEPAVVNRHRVNNRINNRLGGSIRLRIERYSPTTAANPAAAFTVSRDDAMRVDAYNVLNNQNTGKKIETFESGEGGDTVSDANISQSVR